MNVDDTTNRWIDAEYAEEDGGEDQASDAKEEYQERETPWTDIPETGFVMSTAPDRPRPEQRQSGYGNPSGPPT